MCMYPDADPLPSIKFASAVVSGEDIAGAWCGDVLSVGLDVWRYSRWRTSRGAKF